VKWLIEHWPRKLVAILGAALIWVTMSVSDKAQRTFPAVPVVLTNEPDGAALESAQIPGLPSGLTIPVTLEGSSDELHMLRPDELRVVTDAAEHAETWVASLGIGNIRRGKTLEKLPDGLRLVGPFEVLLRMGSAETVELPVLLVPPPESTAPSGYEVVGVYPQRLTVNVHGPRKWLQQVADTGVALQVSWSHLPQTGQQSLREQVNRGFNEIVIGLPLSQLSLSLPFVTSPLRLSSDLTDELEIVMVRKRSLNLAEKLPIQVQYPAASIEQLNIQTAPLTAGDAVEVKYGQPFLSYPLKMIGVSTDFLQAITPFLTVQVVCAPDTQTGFLPVEIELSTISAARKEFLSIVRRRQPRTPSAMLNARFDTYRKRLKIVDELGGVVDIRSFLDASTGIDIQLKDKQPSDTIYLPQTNLSNNGLTAAPQGTQK